LDANLADFSLSSHGSWSWGTIVFVIVVIAAVVSPFAVRQMRKIRGPVLTGTAQVLSLRQFGSVGEGAGQQVCRIRLRVAIPGHEPYDVTVWRNIAPWNLGAVAPGSTVAVDVSAKNPKKLQVGRSQRIRPQTEWTNTGSNAPPIIYNQSTTPPAGWSGSAPPDEIADQIKAVLEETYKQSQGAVAGSTGPITPPTVAEQANAYKQTAGSFPVISAAALLASGQRVPGVLKSFAATGTTPRSLGRTPSRPELIDAPHHMLEVELQFPKLAPVTARAVQPVPLTQVPHLAIGLKLTCAVDPADPLTPLRRGLGRLTLDSRASLPGGCHDWHRSSRSHAHPSCSPRT